MLLKYTGLLVKSEYRKLSAFNCSKNRHVYVHVHTHARACYLYVCQCAVSAVLVEYGVFWMCALRWAAPWRCAQSQRRGCCHCAWADLRRSCTRHRSFPPAQDDVTTWRRDVIAATQDIITNDCSSNLLADHAKSNELLVYFDLQEYRILLAASSPPTSKRV